MKLSNLQREVEEALLDTGKPQDKADNTKLLLLANKILARKKQRSKYLGYVQAINFYATQLEKLSQLKIVRLCKVINLAKLEYGDYALAYYRAFQKWNPTSKNTTKRAEIFRLICESGLPIEIDFVFNETEIRNTCPWHWIDAAVYASWWLAKFAIKEQLEENNNLSPIWPGLFQWRDFHADKQSFQEMLEDILSGIRLKKKEREFLDSFFAAW